MGAGVTLLSYTEPGCQIAEDLAKYMDLWEGSLFKIHKQIPEAHRKWSEDVDRELMLMGSLMPLKSFEGNNHEIEVFVFKTRQNEYFPMHSDIVYWVAVNSIHIYVTFEPNMHDFCLDTKPILDTDCGYGSIPRASQASLLQLSNEKFLIYHVRNLYGKLTITYFDSGSRGAHRKTGIQDQPSSS